MEGQHCPHSTLEYLYQRIILSRTGCFENAPSPVDLPSLQRSKETWTALGGRGGWALGIAGVVTLRRWGVRLRCKEMKETLRTSFLWPSMRSMSILTEDLPTSKFEVLGKVLQVTGCACPSLIRWTNEYDKLAGRKKRKQQDRSCDSSGPLSTNLDVGDRILL